MPPAEQVMPDKPTILASSPGPADALPSIQDPKNEATSATEAESEDYTVNVEGATFTIEDMPPTPLFDENVDAKVDTPASVGSPEDPTANLKHPSELPEELSKVEVADEELRKLHQNSTPAEDLDNSKPQPEPIHTSTNSSLSSPPDSGFIHATGASSSSTPTSTPTLCSPLTTSRRSKPVSLFSSAYKNIRAQTQTRTQAGVRTKNGLDLGIPFYSNSAQSHSRNASTTSTSTSTNHRSVSTMTSSVTEDSEFLRVHGKVRGVSIEDDRSPVGAVLKRRKEREERDRGRLNRDRNENDSDLNPGGTVEKQGRMRAKSVTFAGLRNEMDLAEGPGRDGARNENRHMDSRSVLALSAGVRVGSTVSVKKKSVRTIRITRANTGSSGTADHFVMRPGLLPVFPSISTTPEGSPTARSRSMASQSPTTAPTNTATLEISPRADTSGPTPLSYTPEDTPPYGSLPKALNPYAQMASGRDERGFAEGLMQDFEKRGVRDSEVIHAIGELRREMKQSVQGLHTELLEFRSTFQVSLTFHSPKC